MELFVDYLEESLEVSLVTTEKTRAWVAIVRACQDYSDLAIRQYKEGTEIRFLWRSFLVARESIGYQTTKYAVQVKFSERARTLLEDALRKQNLYHRSERKYFSEADLDAALKKNGFSRNLTPEQKRNVLKLTSLSACASFSVPGAGKTTEALAYYCCIKSKEIALLIVCPKNAFAVWEEQIAEIFKTRPLRVQRLIGGAESIDEMLKYPPDVALITYHQLSFASNTIAGYLNEFKPMMILDESHRMKRGNAGAIGSAILAMAHLPAVKCLLTGTPMPNGLADLVPQFQFLYPDIPVNPDNVRDKIKPVFVRTTKKELNIPGITRRLIEIDPSPMQRILYQLLCSEFARQDYGQIGPRDRRTLRSLGKSALRLIQLLSNPALLAKNIDLDHQEFLRGVLEEGDSPKLRYVTNRARELASKGHKTIIWSSFVANVELVSTRLTDLGSDFIHGGVEAGDEEEDTRERKIKRFHDDKNAWVLVANPAACGEGISLHTVCHHAIYLDRNYNAAQYLQSEDRIHRLGLKQGQETVVEILSCPGTIDELVNKRLLAKIQLMKEVLDDPDIHEDPIPFDPDDNEEFSSEDARDFVEHLKIESKVP